MQISLILFFVVTILSASIEKIEQCWINNIAHPTLINQTETSKTNKFEFSLH